jgi:hypothetical protein
MNRNRWTIWGAVLALFFVCMGVGVASASAHTPSGGASCEGYFVKAVSYESRNTNIISSTFDGVTTSRQFATNDQITGSWPQDGVSHTWSGFVHTNNTNQAYSKDYGPITLTCGPPPPPSQHETRSSKTTPTCKNPIVTTTTEARDETFAWDGSQYVGTWSPWHVTSVTKTRAHVSGCTVSRHAHVSVSVTDKCNCFMDKVKFFWNSDKVRLRVTHPTRTTWVAHVRGLHVGNKQFLLPKHLNGDWGWAKTQTYTVHTTNVPCPCHLTHSCPQNGPPHHSCKTLACKLS